MPNGFSACGILLATQSALSTSAEQPPGIARTEPSVLQPIAKDSLDQELRGPTEPVLARIDPLLATPISLNTNEFRRLVDFVSSGLLDKRARPEHLRKLVPEALPSGEPMLQCQFEDLPDME